MPPKRGLSLEEKRAKLLEVFHESKDVFVLKDVEKLGSKKGVVSQSIKEVLQSLVDDDLVHQERIGASNYFWSFPGEAAAKIEQGIKRTQTQLDELEAQEKQLTAKVEEARKSKPDAAELEPKLATMRALEQKQGLVQSGLAQYADADPERLKALHNIECLRTFVKKMNEGREADIDSFFQQEGVTEAMEYIEEE